MLCSVTKDRRSGVPEIEDPESVHKIGDAYRKSSPLRAVAKVRGCPLHLSVCCSYDAYRICDAGWVGPSKLTGEPGRGNKMHTTIVN
jgi:hypothetical protein